MALARFVVTADIPAAAWPGAGNLTVTPAVPASTVAQFNTNGYPVQVTVTGGTVTVISVNGTVTGQTSGTVTVPAGGTIAITYSVAPAWTWVPFGGMPAGYFQPRIPKGTVVYADSAAGSTGPQLLYQYLNGVSALRAFVQGQDDVGHAGISN